MISKKWLINKDACTEGIAWFITQSNKSEKALLKSCIADNHLDWANWVMVRKLNKINKINYAIFAAKQVLNIFERPFPKDKRPRMAIQATEKYIKNPNKTTKQAAYAAAYAVNAVPILSIPPIYLHPAAYAAYYATHAAAYAISTAYYATHAAGQAIDAAACAVDGFQRNKLRIKILRYGIKLLNLQK